MKKKNLKLSELKVESFTTSMENIKGGFTIVTTDPYTYYPTKKCPTEETVTAGGIDPDEGICQAASRRNCPTENC